MNARCLLEQLFESGELPVVSFPVLWHVGTLDPKDKEQSSYEGHVGISVSTEPQHWVKVAKLGGRPLWKLTRPGNQFLDVRAMQRPADDKGTWGLTAWEEKLAEQAKAQGLDGLYWRARRSRMWGPRGVIFNERLADWTKEEQMLERLSRVDTVGFEWDNDAMHDMEGLPTSHMAVSDLKWHFKKQFWSTKGKVGANGGDLRPQQVLDNPAAYPEHARRILDADLSFPLHVWQNQAGKWIILDGLHRLAKAFLEGKEYVQVKKVPKGRKSEITEGGMSDMLRASRGQPPDLTAHEGTIKYAGKMQTSWNFSNGVTVIGGLRPLNSGVKVEMIVSTLKGQGAAEAALRWLKERHGPIRPVSVLPDAKLFWKKMRLKGLCS